MNKVSVVSVCYNDYENLEKTILSVIAQIKKGADLEYIVIDGGSNDGTLDLFEKYKSFISISLSEKDSGIFDAMNKGLNIASGDSIVFLNSGDVFFDKFNLKSFQENNDLVNYSIFTYTIQKDKSISYLRPKRNKKVYTFRDFGHQGCFISKNSYKKFKFNKDLSISADSYWLKNIWLEGNIKKSEEITAIFNLGGVSNTFTFQNLKRYLKQPVSIKFKLRWIIKVILSHVVSEKIVKKYLYKKYEVIKFSDN